MLAVRCGAKVLPQKGPEWLGCGRVLTGPLGLRSVWRLQTRTGRRPSSNLVFTFVGLRVLHPALRCTVCTWSIPMDMLQYIGYSGVSFRL